jgi:hypothetical protein
MENSLFIGIVSKTESDPLIGDVGVGLGCAL